MIELTADECRVLGVLIEKALTTPNQYPLTLNAIVEGASQKNNRAPVLEFDEEQIRSAIESLREKGLAIRVDQMGARVSKFRHSAGERLAARTGELAILAELLLRGPQTLGELRGRASRMHPMETLGSTRDLLRALMERSEPLARQLPPLPGSRAERYAHLLSPEIDEPEPAAAIQSSPAAPAPSLSARVEQLEAQVAALQSALRQLAASLGEPDPLVNEDPMNAEE